MSVTAAKWDTQLETQLADSHALRVIPSRALLRMADSISRGISTRTVERWTVDALRAGRLVRVQRGLYLNALTRPIVQNVEAAPWIRRDAVVSLQRALGDAGVWNNYTDMVTCVVPLRTDEPAPSLGQVRTQAGTFVFHGVPLAIVEAGSLDDRLDLERSQGYDHASAEAALLHWIYLGRSPRSHLTPPPFEMDMEELDRKRLSRLARAQGIEDAAEEWLSRKRDYDRTQR